jgi:hypothetical protein
MMVSNLYLFFNYFTAEKLLIASILLGLLFRIYYLLNMLDLVKDIKIKNKTLGLCKTKIILLLDIFEHKLWNFFEDLTKNSDKYNLILFKVAEFLFFNLPSKYFTFCILFVDVFSKVIVILSFLIDIFYFKQINYFYKTVILLLLPFLLYIIKTSLLQYHKKQTQNLFIDYIDSKPIPYSEYHEFCFKEGVNTSEFYDNFDTFFYVVFCPVFEIQYVLFERVKIYIDYKVDWIKLILCIIYFLGWSYILLIGINF